MKTLVIAAIFAGLLASQPVNAYSTWDIHLLADGYETNAIGVIDGGYSNSLDSGDAPCYLPKPGDSSIAIIKAKGLDGWTEPDTLLGCDARSDSIPQNWVVRVWGDWEHDMFFISDMVFDINVTNLTGDTFQLDWAPNPWTPEGLYGSISLPAGEYLIGISTVPEPGTIITLLAGFAGLAGFVRRK